MQEQDHVLGQTSICIRWPPQARVEPWLLDFAHVTSGKAHIAFLCPCHIPIRASLGAPEGGTFLGIALRQGFRCLRLMSVRTFSHACGCRYYTKRPSAIGTDQFREEAVSSKHLIMVPLWK